MRMRHATRAYNCHSTYLCAKRDHLPMDAAQMAFFERIGIVPASRLQPYRPISVILASIRHSTELKS